MCDETSSGEIFEVPIMLSTENLSYDDIAKLNPFYEEYNAFWTDPLVTPGTSYSSDGSSITSSLRSMSSEDSYFSPFGLAQSPLCHIEQQLPLCIPEKLQVAVRSGGECKPAYSEYDACETSFTAVLEPAERQSLPLSPIKECSETHEPDIPGPLSFDYQLAPTKTSHKKLFGDNGWLGCTAELEVPSKSRSKTLKGLGRKLKQHVGEIAGDMAKSYPNPFHGFYKLSAVVDPAIPISLDPTTQGKLYFEMEVMICLSANRFLIQQDEDGRLSRESIRKTNQFWSSKNRPQVVEFQYDQATQRRLILSNIRTLHFNGESSTNPVLLHSNLQNWKAIVKEMSIRTFCAPDSVIRKHIHDIHKLLDMLDAPVNTFIAFQKLQMSALSSMNDHLVKNYRTRKTHSRG